MEETAPFQPGRLVVEGGLMAAVAAEAPGLVNRRGSANEEILTKVGFRAITVIFED
jgi:hypothetical protein